MTKKAKTEVIDPAENTEVMTPQNQNFDLQENSAERLISLALTNNVPVETIERLMAMRRELKAEWAREQYNLAMAAFQAECPVIEKRKLARDESRGKDLYKYAPLDDIIAQTQELIAKHGFSYTFRQTNDGNVVQVACIVSHTSGHSEESVMATGLATKTLIMSGPQQIASTVTFNKRYSFCNAFGIMTGDEDVDAAKNVVESPTEAPRAPKQQPQQASLPQFITREQSQEINRLCKTLRYNMPAIKGLIIDVTGQEKEYKNLTSDEAKKLTQELKKRLEMVQKYEGVNMVDPSVSIPPKEEKADTESYGTRAMNCKTQEEANDIIGEAVLDKHMTEARMKAITNILIQRGFGVQPLA